MINFEALRKAVERMNDSKDGKFGCCGNWKIALGGYDHGYEVYYKDEPVMRVNYELDEYEFYSCDYSDVMFTPDTVPQIKKVLEITPEFDNVGDIDDNGDYIDRFGQYVNGVEANVSESGISKLVKFKKIVKESEGGDAPRIYVGTYAKYNDGSIDGEWVDLTDFAHDYDGFVKHCREIHKDEKDPEFMIQDYEGFPRKWYHEAGLPTEEEFDKIIEISELDDSEKNAYDAYLELDFSDDSIEAFREHYYGTYDGDYDLGMDFVDRFGMPDNPEQYFDYDRFGRDLMYEYHYGDPDNTDSEGNQEDPDYYYDNDGY